MPNLPAQSMNVKPEPQTIAYRVSCERCEYVEELQPREAGSEMDKAALGIAIRLMRAHGDERRHHRAVMTMRQDGIPVDAYINTIDEFEAVRA